MDEDITFTGKAQHIVSLFAVLQRIESMFPQTACMWIVCMLVNEITGHRKRSGRGRRKGQDAAQRVLLHQEIACSERQAILWNDTCVFKAAFRMQLAVHDALLTVKIVRRDKHAIMNLEPEREMSRILKLVPYVAPEVGYMPAHAEWGDGAHYAAGVELPAMVGIIQVAMRGKVVTGDHDTFLHPICCCTGRRYRFAYAILRTVAAE